MFDLQAKLGPLPVWAWGLLGGGAVAGVFWFNQLRDKNGETITDGSDDSQADTSGDFQLPGSSDLLDWGYRPSGITSGGSSTPVETSVDTNSAWGIRAIAALIGKGVSPIAAQTAINKYLAGEEITSDQAKLIDQAVKEVGQPPEGGLIPNVKVPTPTAPAPAATIKSYVRLANGQIQAIMSDGKAVNVSDREYINRGMPKLVSDAYKTRTIKLSKNTTPTKLVKAFPSTTADKIMITNGWTSWPNLKKGMSIKIYGTQVGSY